jgi:hypothetical protein
MASAIFRGEGQAKLSTWPVASSTAISKGDMLWYDSGTTSVKPASSFTWDTNIATTQTAFNKLFVGIAYTAKAASDTSITTIEVDSSTDGVWEMDIASTTLVQGASLGPAKASGNALENQKLAAAAITAACGRANEHYASATTRVKATFAPVYNTGSNNVNGKIG